MTPAEAAEGRRLLETRKLYEATFPGVARQGSHLNDWLWANREELVRCAELAAERAAPTGPAPADWSWVPRVGQRVRFTAGKREEGSVEAVHVPPHGNGIDVLPDGSDIPCICDPTQIEPLPDPRLAHALANPPGPRHTVVREALASARLDGETVPLEPQGAPCSHDWTFGRCDKCGMYWCDYDLARAKGAPQKPKGET